MHSNLGSQLPHSYVIIFLQEYTPGYTVLALALF